MNLLEKYNNPGCFCDFSHGAVIKTESGRSLGATCDPEEAESIIKTYFETEIFPERVHVFFDGILGFAFSLKGKENEKMTDLLKNKYNNVLELIQEMGKIPVRCIDDGDLEALTNEIEELGYKCRLDSSTDYLLVTK